MKSSEINFENLTLNELIWKFGQNYVDAYQQKFNTLPIAEIDPESTSPCQVSATDDENATWKAIKIVDELDFDNINNALNVEIHQDIKTYFCTMYADSIHAQHEDGKLSLLFAWNHEDFLRLQENIIGHIMMKQRLKQKITIFFAVTDEEDMIVSLDNDSGEVWLERVGCEPHRKLADNVMSFISSLSFDFVTD